MFGPKFNLTMTLDGYKTKQLKKASDDPGSDTVLEIDLSCELTKAQVSKLGPVAERVLLAEADIANAADGDVHPDIDGSFRIRTEHQKENYHISAQSNGNGKGAKTLKLRTQRTDKAKLHAGKSVRLKIPLLAEHDKRTLDWLRENVRQTVRVDFKSEQESMI